MEKPEILIKAKSAIKECHNLRSWIGANDSKNEELLDLVADVEALITKMYYDNLSKAE